MEAVKPLLLVPTREIAPLGLDAWVSACGQALSKGARMMMMFGRIVEADQVITTAVLQGTTGALCFLRGRGKRGQNFSSLTPAHPGVQMFERELWEQTGLVPDGHPWLKPVRYEGVRQQDMHRHPFFRVRGQEIHEVGVGPIHASVIEPGHFRFMCHGEQVHHLEIQLGYQHRAVEQLLLRRPPLSLTPLVETIVGDSSIAYAWGYCAAAEALVDATVDQASDVARGIALELERIAMHLATLAGLCTDIAFLQGGATYGRLRTAVINATMRASGSRFGRGWLRPGGMRHCLDDERRQDLITVIADLSKDLAQVNALVLGARSVQARFQGVGVVDHQCARDIGLVGLVARASGWALDTRASMPGRLYASLPLTTLTEDSGDCWARLKLRMREIDESVRWIGRALEEPAVAGVKSGLHGAGANPLRPDAMCVSVCEGFRGPIVQVLETDADGRLVHYKVQDPSLQNWFGLTLAMRENEISDFPICNKSFDLSYSGNDL